MFCRVGGCPRVFFEINGHRRTAGDAGWPITPGRSNSLTIRVRDGEVNLPLTVTLIRIQSDGRQQRSSARLTAESPRASLELGLFAVPPAFDFEAGIVYRRGTRFRVEIDSAGKPSQPAFEFHQTIDTTNDSDMLAPGAPERVVHLGGLLKSSRPMDPPIELWLAPEVLSDPNDVRVCLKLRAARDNPKLLPEDAVTTIAGRLRVTSEPDGNVLVQLPVEIGQASSVHRLEVAHWPEGQYRIELVLDVSGIADREGPVVVYRRVLVSDDTIQLSPLAPWAFERDPNRAEIRVDDFQHAVAQWSSGMPDARV